MIASFVAADSWQEIEARVLAELEKPSTLGFGFHFGDQPFGYILQNGENRTWQPVPTDALFPAPRTCCPP